MAALPQGFPAGMFGMGGPGGAPAPLVKFKAGRCELEPLSGAQEGSFNVTPIKRKGEVQVVRNDEGMTQFLWKDRTTQQVDPACDHLVFPGDAKFEKISTGRDGDRVYSLQFTANASRRFFFWMQDKDDGKDEENMKAVNTHLNRTGDSGEGDSIPPGATPEQAAMMQNLMLFGQGGPGAAGGAASGEGGASSANAPAGQVSLADLQSVMASLGMPPTSAGAPAAAAPAAAAPAAAAPAAAASPGAGGSLTAADLQAAMMGISTGARRGTPLELVLSADDVLSSGVLDDPQVQERLLPLLPEEQRNPSELRSLVRSPQFQQALGSLSSALHNPDNFNSVFANFGLNPTAGASAMASGDGTGALLAAIEEQARSSTDSENKDESGDTKMEDSGDA